MKLSGARFVFGSKRPLTSFFTRLSQLVAFRFPAFEDLPDDRANLFLSRTLIYRFWKVRLSYERSDAGAR
jgi:hypothetical protein